MLRLFEGCVSIPKFVIFLIFLATKCQSLQSSKKEPYVVDTRYPLVISDKAFENDTTSFGMSVALSSEPNKGSGNRPSGWVFIGAPTSNSTDPTYKRYTEIINPGVLWRCSLGRKFGSDTCEILNIDPSTGKPGDQKTKKLESPAYEDEGNSWIGGNVEVKDGRLITCSPRWTRGVKTFMNGMCYWLSENGSQSFHDDNFKIDNRPKTFHHRLIPFFSPENSASRDQFFEFVNNGKIDKYQEWALGQAGFSLQVIKNVTGGAELLLGAPGVRLWSGAVVRYIDKEAITKGPNFRLNRNVLDSTYSEYVVAYRGTKESSDKINLKPNHWFEYFGYAVSSGRYFTNGTLVYAGGAPRGNDLSGEVVLFNIPDPADISKNSEESYKRMIDPILVIQPPADASAFGSYFGSVLFTLDIDGDGRDELFVGAPLYTAGNLRHKRSATEDQPFSGLRDANGDFKKKQKWSGDHGSVFVYSFGANRTISQMQILNGSMTPASRFGSAISYLNMSGLHIVIGAPNEKDGKGTIYIYKAERQLGQYVQRVLASDISNTLSGFGCSISLPMDIDDNGTPDLAIGAYNSKQVVVLRTRPNISLFGNVTFKGLAPWKGKVPKGAEKITLNVCLKVNKEIGNMPPQLAIWASLMLDTRLSIKSFRNKAAYFQISKSTIIYQTNVSTDGTEQCEEMVVTINDTRKPEEVEVPITIRQDLWYNETAEEGLHLLEYNATSGTRANVFASSNRNFKEFKSESPQSVQSTSGRYSVELLPNDCEGPICRPNLSITVEWFTPDQIPISEYIIGSYRHVQLRVNISNNGETAKLPRFNIRWQRRNVLASREKNSWLLSPSSCKPENLTDGYAYDCHFSQNIIRNRIVSRSFHFDMKEVLANQPSENFKVALSVYPLYQQTNYIVNRNSSLIVKANSTVTLVGSKDRTELRNVFEYNCTKLQFDEIGNKMDKIGYTDKFKLYSPWRQTYRVHITGSSGVECIKLSFKLPWRLSINQPDSPTPVALVNQITNSKTDNIKCKIPKGKGHFYLIQASKPGAGESAPDLGETLVLEAGHVKSSVSNKFPSVEESQHRGMAPADLRVETIPKIPKVNFDDKIITIHCNGSEFDCIQVECTATNIKVDYFLDIAFDIYLVKDSLDELMKDGKTVVLVESIGSVTIFNAIEDNAAEDFRDIDVAQTLFTRVQTTKVYFWIYIVASVVGVFLLALIIFIMYKCGFFKRGTKQQLENLKAEVRKSMIPTNFRLDESNEESRKELIDRDELSESTVQSVPGKPSGQSVVEKL